MVEGFDVVDAFAIIPGEPRGCNLQAVGSSIIICKRDNDRAAVKGLPGGICYCFIVAAVRRVWTVFDWRIQRKAAFSCSA